MVCWLQMPVVPPENCDLVISAGGTVQVATGNSWSPSVVLRVTGMIGVDVNPEVAVNVLSLILPVVL